PALDIHDLLGDLAERALARIHALDQPDGRAKLLHDVRPGLVTRIAQERAVERVDPEPRNTVLVQHDHILVAHIVYDHVGHDVARVAATEAATRLGLEAHALL